jgi:hypothetical protein
MPRGTAPGSSIEIVGGHFAGRYIHRVRSCTEKDKACYRSEGHGHRVAVEGRIFDLKGLIYHDDRKSLSRWISSQQRYAVEEARYLLKAAPSELSRMDKIRLMGWPSPVLVLFYTLFAKGCIMDGWAGWHYALQRLAAETLIALEVVDRRFRCKG